MNNAIGVGFVGRRKELREIKQLFSQGNVRTIILHGIGGIGKTATATQAARRPLMRPGRKPPANPCRRR